MKPPKELELMEEALQRCYENEVERSDHDSKEVKASIVHTRADVGSLSAKHTLSYIVLKQIRNALWLIALLIIYGLFFH